MKKFTFEIYNYENKIEDNKILKLHEILKNDYIQKNGIELYNQKFNKDSYKNWYQLIKSNNYNIVICYDNSNIVGFLCYMIDESDLILCEIQIIPEYQSKYKIFKMLLQHLPCLNNIDKIKCTIKDDNIHSIECFKNIGMTNKNDFWYQMDYKIFLSNINKGLIN
jgi:hypothetical protein